MACKKVKEDKEKVKNDPYINDPRYVGLKSDVREAFQIYLQKNKNGSLTDFLSKRKIINEKMFLKGADIEGKRIIETTSGGAIQTRILINGEID